MSRIALSGNAHAVREPFDDGTQRGQLDGLREIGVHAGGEARFAVAVERVRGHRHDRNVAATRRLGPATLACGLLLAVIPGRRAARLRAGPLLREE